MGKKMRAWALAIATCAGCRALLSDPDRNLSPDASVTDAPYDAALGQPPDGGVDSDADARDAARGPCAAANGLLFCDDFEDRGRIGPEWTKLAAIDAGWDQQPGIGIDGSSGVRFKTGPSGGSSPSFVGPSWQVGLSVSAPACVQADMFVERAPSFTATVLFLDRNTGALKVDVGSNETLGAYTGIDGGLTLGLTYSVWHRLVVKVTNAGISIVLDGVETGMGPGGTGGALTKLSVGIPVVLGAAIVRFDNIFVSNDCP